MAGRIADAILKKKGRLSNGLFVSYGFRPPLPIAGAIPLSVGAAGRIIPRT